MNYKNSMSVTLLGLSLIGCTSVISKETIIDNSSVVTGNKIVSIGEIKRIGSDSYYEAKAEDGTIYSCSFNGGDVIDMGHVQHQKCVKK